MKKNKKYLQAAKLTLKKVDKHDYTGCCIALAFVDKSDEYFLDFFKPDLTIRGYWFGDLTKNNSLARSLALLLMYEMGAK